MKPTNSPTESLTLQPSKVTSETPSMQPTDIVSTLNPTMNKAMNSNTGVNVAKVILLIASSVISFVIGLAVLSWFCIYKRKQKQTTDNSVQLIKSQKKNDSLFLELCDGNDIKIIANRHNITEIKSRLIKQMKT
eukprot:138250_1